MKISSNTASIAAVLISIGTSSMAGAYPANIDEDNKSSSSSVSHGALHHHPLIRHAERNKSIKRNLQEPTVCEQAYMDLHNNTLLAEAAKAYFDEYFENVATTTKYGTGYSSAGCKWAGNHLACDYRFYIAAYDKFESACTNLGAKVVQFNNGFNCSIELVDNPRVIYPYVIKSEPIDCFPAGCEGQTTLSKLREAGQAFAEAFETSPIQPNTTSIECIMGSGTVIDDSTGTDTTSSAASAGSKTIMLVGVLITAVLYTIF